MKIKIKKLSIFFVLIFVGIFCSACFSDLDDTNGIFGNLSGFKTTYRPNEYPYVDFYQDFAYDTLYNFYDVFYARFEQKYFEQIYKQSNNVDTIDKTSEQWKQFEILFASDTQYSTNVLKNNYGANIDPSGNTTTQTYYYAENFSWNWPLKIDNSYHYFGSNTYCTNVAEISEFYQNLKINQTVLDAFKAQITTYANALQVNILQIVLGKQVTVFDNNFDDAAAMLGTASLVDGNVVATGLKGELVKNGTVVGFDAQTKQKIIDCIVDNIVGEQKYNADNTKLNFTRSDYVAVLEAIWADEDVFVLKNTLDATDTKSYGYIFDSYPALCIQDFGKNTLFIDSDNSKAFKNIPSAQYQSVVFMTDGEAEFEEFWLFLASETQMTVKYYVRYFDKTSNTLYTSSTMQVQTVAESDFNAERSPLCMVSLNFAGGDSIRLEKFNNQIGGGAIAADNAKTMNSDSGIFYDTNPSFNGYGTVAMLDQNAFSGADGCSFLEIVFDVQKDSDTDNSSFKIGMFYVG